ncbi:MAG TPA: hypothetical protein VKE22_21635 [Haliangiales bacterium]|nr:hypothetical protein [Haliangiales bacterium]
MKNKLFATVLAGLFSLGFVACDKKEEGGAKPAETKPAETKPAETKPAEAKKEEAKPPGGDNKVGVAACDEWMEKYTKCIDSKVPEAARAQMKDAMKQTADTWRQTASTPEGKTALENACKQMIESTKQATASFGCEW